MLQLILNIICLTIGLIISIYVSFYGTPDLDSNEHKELYRLALTLTLWRAIVFVCEMVGILVRFNDR